MADIDMPSMGEPVQFSWLPSFKQSGIYFLWYEGVVVYVGQALNMRGRIASHLSEGRKIFDAVSCRPMKGNFNYWERYYIERLLPKYNQCHFAKQARLLNKLDPDFHRIEGPWRKKQSAKAAA